MKPVIYCKNAWIIVYMPTIYVVGYTMNVGASPTLTLKLKPDNIFI